MRHWGGMTEGLLVLLACGINTAFEFQHAMTASEVVSNMHSERC